MQKYHLGHVISDNSNIGKMKDSYPLKLFSTETVLKSIDFKDYHILLFILPFNIIIESLKNPNLSISNRCFFIGSCLSIFILSFISKKTIIKTQFIRELVLRE